MEGTGIRDMTFFGIWWSAQGLCTLRIRNHAYFSQAIWKHHLLQTCIAIPVYTVKGWKMKVSMCILGPQGIYQMHCSQEKSRYHVLYKHIFIFNKFLMVPRRCVNSNTKRFPRLAHINSTKQTVIFFRLSE